MAKIMRTNGVEEQLNDLSLESLIAAVGGYIEPVWIGGRLMLVDEEGQRKDRTINAAASFIAGMHIVGDVVLLTVEETKEWVKT